MEHKLSYQPELCTFVFPMFKSINGWCQINKSEKICFLHDPLKFFIVDFTITITVSLVNHFLKLFISQSLPQFFGHPLEVLETNPSSLVIIKQFEGLVNLLRWVTVENLMSHHLQKFWVIN